MPMLSLLHAHHSHQQYMRPTLHKHSLTYPGNVLTMVPPDGEHAAYEEGVQPRGELLGVAALGCMLLKAGHGPDGGISKGTVEVNVLYMH